MEERGCEKKKGNQEELKAKAKEGVSEEDTKTEIK